MNDNIPDQYAAYYLEGLQLSTAPTRAAMRREARAYAAEMCPAGDVALVAFSKLGVKGSNGQGRPTTELEILGQHTGAAMGRAAKVFWRTMPKLEKKPISARNGASTNGHAGLRKTFMQWVNECDFVPDDKVLAAFTHSSVTNFSAARAHMRDMGYVFQGVPHGWKVVSRPPIKVEKPIDQPEPIATPPDVANTTPPPAAPITREEKIKNIAAMLADLLG